MIKKPPLIKDARFPADCQPILLSRHKGWPKRPNIFCFLAPPITPSDKRRPPAPPRKVQKQQQPSIGQVVCIFSGRNLPPDYLEGCLGDGLEPSGDLDPCPWGPSTSGFPDLVDLEGQRRIINHVPPLNSKFHVLSLFRGDLNQYTAGCTSL